MNDRASDLAVNGSARRRLLRGTFAAPAVLTLYSGGALAAASTTCVAKAQANAQTGGVVDDGATTDTFLRVQLHQTTGSGGGTKYWLWGDAIQAFNGAGSIVQQGRYTRFLTDTNVLSAVPTEVNQSLTPSPPLSSNPAKSVALRFDGSGKLVGVGAAGGGSAITGSCWNSIY